jgi:ribonuclease HI
VTTTGWYGVSGHPNPPSVIGREAVVVAELRAVWRAVRDLHASRVTCLVDSIDALGYLRAWQAGDMPMPGGYRLRSQRISGNTSSLERLAELLYYDGGRFTFGKVKAHAGHSLNEAADSLARLGLRAGSRSGVPLDRVEDAARSIAAHRLDDYRKSAGVRTAT